MKKIVLMAVALLSMTTATFAAEEENEAASAYNMNVNVAALARTLDLTIDQTEAVNDVHKTFAADMLTAGRASEANRKEMVDKAIDKDLKYMKSILSKNQYHRYLLLLNTTLVNHGIEK